MIPQTNRNNIDCCATVRHMGKTLLIHGYAANLTAWKLRQAFGEHAGFAAFDEAVASAEAAVFRWGIDRTLTLAQSINPFSYLKLYRDEEKLAESAALQQGLLWYIEKHNIKRIICHSLGCRLLLGAMNGAKLPSSVKSIVFLQADFPSQNQIDHLDATNRIEIENYSCFWDQSLLASTILHGNLRAGLVGWKQSNIKNTFYPLLKAINLHTSPMRDRKLAKKLFDT